MFLAAPWTAPKRALVMESGENVIENSKIGLPYFTYIGACLYKELLTGLIIKYFSEKVSVFCGELSRRLQKQ